MECIYANDICTYLAKDKTFIRANKSLHSVFFNSLLSLDDHIYSLRILNKLKHKGLDVEDVYVAIVLKASRNLELDKRIILLDDTLSLFKNENIINEKFNIADRYNEAKNYSTAISIFTQLIG